MTENGEGKDSGMA